MATPALDIHRLTQQQVATLLSLSSRQINNLEKEDMPGVKVNAGKKVYDGPVVVKWYWEKRMAKAVAEASPPDEWDAQARLHAASAGLKELDLAERRGSLLTAEYVSDQLSRILTRIKESVSTLPGKYAQRFVGLKTITHSQSEWRKIMNEILRTLAEVGGDPALDESDKKAA